MIEYVDMHSNSSDNDPYTKTTFGFDFSQPLNDSYTFDNLFNKYSIWLSLYTIII